MKPGGIFSLNPDVNPYFYNANKVYLRFCSSDAWSGDGSSMINGTMWQFKGLKHISATLDALMNNYGLGSSSKNGDDTTRVMLSGCSAGGQGVVNALDFVAEYLDNALGSNVIVKGLADAGWMMEVEKLRSNVISVHDQFVAGYTTWKSKPNQNCVNSANPGSEYQCLFSCVIHDTLSSEL
jgi:hypothetical protein